MKWGFTKQQCDNRDLFPITNFKEEIDSFFKGFFSEDTTCSGTSFSPNVDVKEDDKSIYIETELPGMDEKEINVELKDNILTIKGEKKEEKESNGKKDSRLERRYGSFKRSFTLPDEVVADKIIATFKKGVLKIELPKDENKASKRLKINVE